MEANVLITCHLFQFASNVDLSCTISVFVADCKSNDANDSLNGTFPKMVTLSAAMEYIAVTSQ
jgi:hypothetical protein